MSITHLLGELDGIKITKPKIILRKSNKIKTIQASLSIEGNTLSIEQVSDLIEGIPVLGQEKDILEAKNAITTYETLPTLNHRPQVDFKKAHKLMMNGLTKGAGRFRDSNVGVFAGSNVAHVAPQHKMVPKLMGDLFTFLKKNDETSLIIKSCIFHYELEFIHPFSDGNGRMGRLWQHRILSDYHEVFQFVAIDTLIKNKQTDYYAALGRCDSQGESTEFIEFSLGLIENALSIYYNNIQHQPKTPLDRLNIASGQFNATFTRKKYLNLFKNISTATASRDLKLGIEKNLLEKMGDKRLSSYKFKQQK
jgi:Fic family protein